MSRLPYALLASLEGLPGYDEQAFTQVHASGHQITSARINPAKTFDVQAHTFEVDSKIPWTSNGYYLKQRPSFTLDPLLHAGAYYVQEASSMFLEQALRQTADLSQPLKVLDLCAAPGGKSTLIQSVISKDSLLVSNEVIKTRANILAENITKWGAENVVVTNNDPKDFTKLESYFDIIVIDAPCSGSGLFRRNPDAINEWSEANVQLCSQRQQRIIADVLPALKQGGILIYSTCSYSKDEDEVIADWLIDEFNMKSLRLSTDSEWHIVEALSDKHNAYGYRFYPDKVKGEGFFIACMEKQESEGGEVVFPKKSKLEKLSKNEIAIAEKWIREDAAISILKWKELALALPERFVQDIDLLQQSLYIKQAGVALGQITAKELIPEHALAVSNLLSNNIPAVDITLDEALQYLRKSDLRLDAGSKGWALLQYKKRNLGWVKLLPNRLNNYYPKEWRILK
ncbi:methyltransferase RsmF C-terminal domain-like protein [Pinibacter soli]|uniref:RNA methyltransferase n=1 Tax=Pinibacter soli TaxID=3044211 RepID=A0ABT6RGZ0_9BACT|nr:RNA methyltransferase [Pinibacter soli]MDI3321833.1 RNA methyltransferase [Pinibacter soli]